MISCNIVDNSVNVLLEGIADYTDLLPDRKLSPSPHVSHHQVYSHITLPSILSPSIQSSSVQSYYVMVVLLYSDCHLMR